MADNTKKNGNRSGESADLTFVRLLPGPDLSPRLHHRPRRLRRRDAASPHTHEAVRPRPDEVAAVGISPEVSAPGRLGGLCEEHRCCSARGGHGGLGEREERVLGWEARDTQAGE